MWKVEAQRRTPIEDLNLVVVPNRPLYLTEEQKSRSICLSRLTSLGHVRVSFEERSRLSKDPPKTRAAVARMSRPGTAKARGKVTTRPSVAAPPAESLTPAQAQELAKKAAEEAAKQAVAALMPALQGILAAQQGDKTEDSTLDSRIEQAVTRALQAASIQPAAPVSPGAAPVRAPDEPLFIPSGIVKEGEGADLQIQAEESTADLEAAAKALKNLRRKK